jgi:hypothetical protein
VLFVDSRGEEVKKVTRILRPGQKEFAVDENYDFQIYCRLAEPKSVMYYFRTATVIRQYQRHLFESGEWLFIIFLFWIGFQLRLISSAEDIKLLKGHSPMRVYLDYTQSSRWFFWAANFLPWRARDVSCECQSLSSYFCTSSKSSVALTYWIFFSDKLPDI